MTKKIDKQSLPSDEGKVQELENKINELDNQLKRAVADYHNLEKRVSEGRSELTKWGTSELIRKILPTLDHLETVVQSGRQVLSGQSESKDWFRGVELSVKELKQVLQSEGLEEIQDGGGFDPNLHEAVDTREPSSAEASEGKGENSILQVVRKGYTLNGKVLRPAAVVVGRRGVTLGNEVTPESEDSGHRPKDDRPLAGARMTDEKGEMSS